MHLASELAPLREGICQRKVCQNRSYTSPEFVQLISRCHEAVPAPPMSVVKQASKASGSSWCGKLGRLLLRAEVTDRRIVAR